MKPARVPYLRHNLARFNAEARQKRKTKWLGLVALVVWTGVIRWVTLQECEYHRQRERALAPIETTVAGDSERLSHQSEHYGARIVNETPAGLSLEF